MGRVEREDEREARKRIAASLLCLAVLAELLCFLPLSLRILVLTVLRSAEAVARAFAVERAFGAVALPPAAVCGVDRDGCAEAWRLARCFRVLAAVFGGLQAGRPFRGGPDGRLAQGAPATQRAPAIGRWDHFMKARRAMDFGAAGRFDTS